MKMATIDPLRDAMKMAKMNQVGEGETQDPKEDKDKKKEESQEK